MATAPLPHQRPDRTSQPAFLTPHTSTSDLTLASPITGTDSFQLFKVHRSRLAQHSSVFRDMFEVPSPPQPAVLHDHEAKENDRVTVQEESHVVETLLRCIYTGTCRPFHPDASLAGLMTPEPIPSISRETTLATMEAALKYDVPRALDSLAFHFARWGADTRTAAPMTPANLVTLWLALQEVSPDVRIVVHDALVRAVRARGLYFIGASVRRLWNSICAIDRQRLGLLRSFELFEYLTGLHEVSFEAHKRLL